MIFAELQGKLGQKHTRAHERAEDVLTSTVFGLLRYLPLSDWLGPLAARVRPSPGSAVDSNWLDVASIDSCKIQLWHYRSPFGEPDVTIQLFDSAKRLRHLLVIEVKLYSPKSGSAYRLTGPSPEATEELDAEEKNDDEGEELAGIEKDQLVNYWLYAGSELRRLRAVTHATVDQGPPPTASLIYLTAHATAPVEDLRLSWDAAAQSADTDKPMRLAWLSWFDVWQVVHDATALRSQSLVAQDLERLLKHKGFSRFVGFPPSANLPGPWKASAQFWRRRGWFTSAKKPPVGSAEFWIGAKPLQ